MCDECCLFVMQSELPSNKVMAETAEHRTHMGVVRGGGGGVDNMNSGDSEL